MAIPLFSPTILSLFGFLITTLLFLLSLSFLRFSFSNPFHLGKRRTPPTKMTLKVGGSRQACAACKYQRSKCSQCCPLSPYFPPDQPKMFLNVHRLFGVCNVLKTLSKVQPAQKDEAMRSIIYQAEIRDRYPVHGCCGLIARLRYQIQQAEEELRAVYAQLAICKQQQQQQEQEEISCDLTSELQLGMGPPPPSNDASQSFNAASALNIASHHSRTTSNDMVGCNSESLDEDNGVSSIFVHNPYSKCNNNHHQNNEVESNINSVAMEVQLVASQQLASQQQPAQDYDEIRSFFDIIDDRQSYADSKEACDSSSDSSLKDTTKSIEYVTDNESKSAAVCFSLTSVN